jgi:subtilisin family serine protease
VAGIAAALGNNGTGVTGVNWHTQVMPLVSSGDVESEVVEAYGYVLEMRSRYNETGGNHGAFVVVTNSSFGIDKADPEDYPLWGALYDAMGEEGILSAASTANGDWNVDIEGDVPSGFTSDYLIIATNTTNEDVKFQQAAYGPVSVDLGAPGYVIRSTSNYNEYNNKTGTSMSAPFVAGAVALLISAADTSTINLYHNLPHIISRKFKEHILESVDKLPSLDNITVTEGRLNVYKMLLLQQGEPVLQQDPVSIAVTLGANAQQTTPVELTNVGESTCTFTIYADPPEPWLSVDVQGGTIPAGETGTVGITCNSTGLAWGNYAGEVVAAYDNNLSLRIPVTLHVTPFAGSEADLAGNPLKLALFPNPGSGPILIRFSLPSPSYTSVEITDIHGQLITQLIHGKMTAGEHVLGWTGHDYNGAECSPGIYLCRLVSENRCSVAKIILL